MSNAGDPLAEMAVESIRDGMIVGLGTGRAASRGIEALAARANAESLKLTCVATSKRSAELATTLGLKVVPMKDIERVDVLFDGIDELDPNLAMTKGGGGAMTWEKTVAEAARMRIYLMDQSKKVTHLGEKYPLPVEVLEFSQSAAARRLVELGLTPHLRRSAEGDTTRTDEGNLILDCDYNETSTGDLAALAIAIDRIPGVVGHGLFVNQADVVLIEAERDATGGKIERLVRN